MLILDADKWKYSLGLYELIRDYYNLKYNARLLYITYKLVKKDLYNKVQNNLLLFIK
jgi:hypothetical protein